ncbi:MAG TPA: hypothetical protein VL262_16775 [Vicinamibacterales bacterium]|jgi:hypothetical protein|nr:hypothetical protein [Vicinamibacterales bacterium]
MADKNTPNRASNMERAEGDRDTALTNERTDDRTDEGAAHPGITNRSDDEESNNQQRVPPRGDRKGETHA